jgi:hypothetical protein
VHVELRMRANTQLPEAARLFLVAANVLGRLVVAPLIARPQQALWLGLLRFLCCCVCVVLLVQTPVRRCLPPRCLQVTTIDVATQDSGPRMTMRQLAEYHEQQQRQPQHRLLNVVSLSLADTDLEVGGPPLSPLPCPAALTCHLSAAVG